MWCWGSWTAMDGVRSTPAASLCLKLAGEHWPPEMRQHQQKHLRSEGQKGGVTVVALRAKVRISELWPCCWDVASPASCRGRAVHTGQAGSSLGSGAALHPALRVPETQEGCSSACVSFHEARPRLKVGSNADFAFQKQRWPHKHPGSGREGGKARVNNTREAQQTGTTCATLGPDSWRSEPPGSAEKENEEDTGFLATAWVLCIGFTGMERYGGTSRHRGILMRYWEAGKHRCDDGWRERAGGLPGHCSLLLREARASWSVRRHEAPATRRLGPELHAQAAST